MKTQPSLPLLSGCLVALVLAGCGGDGRPPAKVTGTSSENPQADTRRRVDVSVETPALTFDAAAETQRRAAPDGLAEAQRAKIVGAVAGVLGKPMSEVPLDRPLLDPAGDIEEFDLVEMVLALEDGFDVEIGEEAFERALGGDFREVGKRLTPRDFFAVVAEALRKAPSE